MGESPVEIFNLLVIKSRIFFFNLLVMVKAYDFCLCCVSWGECWEDLKPDS